MSSPPRAAAPATLPKGKAGMKMNGMNNIYVIQFIHRCFKVLAWQGDKFFSRLEMINTNVETAGNVLST